MNKNQGNEYVIKDLSKLGDEAQTARIIDESLSMLDSAAKKLESQNERLGIATQAVADFLQSFACRELGVDIRRISEDSDTSANSLEQCVKLLASLSGIEKASLTIPVTDGRELQDKLNCVTKTIESIHTTSVKSAAEASINKEEASALEFNSAASSDLLQPLR